MERVKIFFFFFRDLTVERMPSASAMKYAVKNWQSKCKFSNILYKKIHDSQKRISKTQHFLIVGTCTYFNDLLKSQMHAFYGFNYRENFLML